jgi:hypothetical protein
METEMSRRARLSLIVGAAGVLAVAAIAVALVVASGGSSAPLRLTTPVAAARPRFPAPPKGSIVFAREDGPDVLALAVVRHAGNDLELQASDVGQEGTGVDGLRVSFAVTAGGVHTASASPCGAGCYDAAVSLPATPSRVRVDVVRATRRTSWLVQLPTPWPPADASALIARATRVWRALKSLSYSDSLGSDASNIVLAHWQIVAPDRLAYQIARSSQAIIIGEKRWDRQAGGAWQESAALRLDQPEPFWVSATDAHVIGSGRFDGRPVWHVSFYDPRTPGWFLVSIDRSTARTLDLHMLATAHFMHDSYGQFDAPIKIVPPTSNN